MDISIVFDGGNGASLEKEAYGSFRIDTGDKEYIERVVFGKGYTNNESEYMTLIQALLHIILFYNIEDRVSHIDLHIEGDSDLVRCQIGNLIKIRVGMLIGSDEETYISKWSGWKVNVAHLLPLRDKARGLLEKFNSFEYKHIPRKQVVAVLGH